MIQLLCYIIDYVVVVLSFGYIIMSSCYHVIIPSYYIMLVVLCDIVM